MTTPRIEEMVQEGKELNIDYESDIDGVVVTTEWLRQALTEAHQAGIDEAVKLVGKQKPVIVNMLQDDSLFIRHGIDGVIGYNEAKKEIIKALQDNK